MPIIQIEVPAFLGTEVYVIDRIRSNDYIDVACGFCAADGAIVGKDGTRIDCPICKGSRTKKVRLPDLSSFDENPYRISQYHVCLMDDDRVVTSAVLVDGEDGDESDPIDISDLFVSAEEASAEADRRNEAAKTAFGIDAWPELQSVVNDHIDAVIGDHPSRS